MYKEVEIRIPPEMLHGDSFQREAIAKALNLSSEEIKDYVLIRRSIDARGKRVVFVLRFRVSLGEPLSSLEPFSLRLKNVQASEPAIIVGFGPAGMFAALRLIELGIKPIILERGKAVRERRRDIAAINKLGVVNPNSNYCFGEGGAGTFSDGKLYTRSTKRGSVERILNIFVAHGADPDILIDAHPHIGTNRLPEVVQAIRKTIVEHGGEIHFETMMSEIVRDSSGTIGVQLEDQRQIKARAVVLATGHSSREVFRLLDGSGITIEAKPFAVGVRVEHPQQVIDEIQYHTKYRHEELPAAAYSFVSQCSGRGVFSFCMCPGGIICPSATSGNEVVVNGWSPSKRNSYFANSGVVVEVGKDDFIEAGLVGAHLEKSRVSEALAGVIFQETLEQRACIQGGGDQVAPAQRLTDFIRGQTSQTLPPCSYLPGVSSRNLGELFPRQMFERLTQGFQNFGKKHKGYLTNEAIVVAIESRTSSPVRIPRDKLSGMHPEVPGLFPTGEGAGYAGGIMSAAMDGERMAYAVSEFYRVKGISHEN